MDTTIWLMSFSSTFPRRPISNSQIAKGIPAVITRGADREFQLTGLTATNRRRAGLCGQFDPSSGV
jgi:hypothetical protein